MLSLIKKFSYLDNALLLKGLCFFETLFFQCLTLLSQNLLMRDTCSEYLVGRGLHNAFFVNKSTVK